MKYDDPKFIKLVGEVNKKIELGSAVSPMSFIPWMVKVFPRRFFNLDFFTDVLNSFNVYAQVRNHYYCSLIIAKQSLLTIGAVNNLYLQ